ncbi:MAG: sulfotransferase [Pseudomonadota bacterium]
MYYLFSDFLDRFRKVVSLNTNAFLASKERRKYRTKEIAHWDEYLKTVLNESQPIFFLSTGRCGTEFITRILENDPNLIVHHNPEPELLGIDRWAYETHSDASDQLVSAFHAARLELMTDAMVRRRQYIETNFRVTFFAFAIATLLPKARFVHLVRHPFDFIRSAVRLQYYEGLYTDMGRIRPSTNSEYGPRWPTFAQAEKAAWLWNETNAFIEAFKSRYAERSVLTIRFEDMVGETAVLSQLLDYCSAKPMSKASLKALQRRPVNRKTAPGQLNLQWGPDMERKVSMLLAKAKTYGYELN